MEHGHDTMKRIRCNVFDRAVASMVLADAARRSPVGRPRDPAPAAKRSPRPTSRRTYATPEDAGRALAEAMRGDDRKLIWRVLGRGSGKFDRSGDPVQDEEAREAFVAAYDKSVKFEMGGDEGHPAARRQRLSVPLSAGDEGRRAGSSTPGAATSRSSTAASAANELAAIKVCLAYVDAQREYALRDRDGNGLLEYAQKLPSAPGTRDGLYWATKAGEPPSPLGPLTAQRADGATIDMAGPTPTTATTTRS